MKDKRALTREMKSRIKQQMVLSFGIAHGMLAVFCLNHIINLKKPIKYSNEATAFDCSQLTKSTFSILLLKFNHLNSPTSYNEKEKYLSSRRVNTMSKGIICIILFLSFSTTTKWRGIVPDENEKNSLGMKRREDQR